ncbi:hypothetical protein CPB86DRAFT_601810 [Serendipita vermifera]|nr:hypothetical protein CPB86DRAFT_601810 [Serendipita vermifera]
MLGMCAKRFLMKMDHSVLLYFITYLEMTLFPSLSARHVLLIVGLRFTLVTIIFTISTKNSKSWSGMSSFGWPLAYQSMALVWKYIYSLMALVVSKMP